MWYFQNDSDHLIYLCLETILNGHSVLVFCPTKNWCEKLADTIAKEFFNLGRPSPSDNDAERNAIRKKIQTQLDGQKLGEVIEQLKRSPAGLDPNLKKCIGFATAYHHAGRSSSDSSLTIT
jgi:DNA polymerase theta